MQTGPLPRATVSPCVRVMPIKPDPDVTILQAGQTLQKHHEGTKDPSPPQTLLLCWPQKGLWRQKRERPERKNKT